jgi:hypothetical protein
VPAAVLLALCCGGRASAQPADDGRFRLSVDAGVQFSPSAFDTEATQRVYVENAPVDASYTITHGLSIDGGVSVRLAGHFGVGVTVSRFTATNDAAVTAAVPHPFFFHAPRAIAGTAAGLERDELVTHVQAVYTLRPSAKVDIALSAGPSFFHVRQAVVTAVSFTDTYPYDTAAFTGASSRNVSGDAAGFNVGADTSWRLSRHAGLGVSARFSRATLSPAMPDGTAPVSIDAGGVQLAGGLRLYF